MQNGTSISKKKFLALHPRTTSTIGHLCRKAQSQIIWSLKPLRRKNKKLIGNNMNNMKIFWKIVYAHGEDHMTANTAAWKTVEEKEIPKAYLRMKIRMNILLCMQLHQQTRMITGLPFSSRQKKLSKNHESPINQKFSRKKFERSRNRRSQKSSLQLLPVISRPNADREMKNQQKLSMKNVSIFRLDQRKPSKLDRNMP